jgi:hypothetical protein
VCTENSIGRPRSDPMVPTIYVFSRYLTAGSSVAEAPQHMKDRHETALATQRVTSFVEYFGTAPKRGQHTSIKYVRLKERRVSAILSPARRAAGSPR